MEYGSRGTVLADRGLFCHRRAGVLDRGRAILKPGIAPKPFVPIRYDPDGSTTVTARNPRRANAKQLRRAYDRAREELRALEREARPKKRKIN